MFTQFGILDFGAPELFIILAIVLVLFGGKKLPELSKGLGESIKELKGAASGANDLSNEMKGQVSEVKASIVGAAEAQTRPVDIVQNTENT
jgi:sec-independent protein translocase protein TatA